MSELSDEASFYDQVGGADTFAQLTAEFYRGVNLDPELRAMYPEDDLGPAEERLRGFLVQYFGGPTTYSQERGHPRLRMRHAPFDVTPDQAVRWMKHMTAAVDSLEITVEQRDAMMDYFHRAAAAMINTLPAEHPLAGQPGYRTEAAQRQNQDRTEGSK